MQMSEQIDKLATALAKAQGGIDNASKDASNPHFRSKYADLASVREAIRQPLSSNGIAYMQFVRFDQHHVEVETMLVHGESGQFVRDTLRMPVAKNDAHGVGSAATYARRYSLMAIVGIAPEDDDGNAAVSKPREDSSQRPAAPAQRPPVPSVERDVPARNAVQPADDRKTSGEVATPTDPKVAALAAAETGARVSAEIKAALIGHLSKMSPGATTFDRDWGVYWQTRTASYPRLTTSDKAIVAAAEQRRQDGHKAEMAKQREEAA